MADSMNMLEIPVGKMLNVIRESIEDEMFDKPLLFLGKSGVGKTESVMQLAKSMNIGFKEFRLVTITETDLIGVPDIHSTDSGVRIGTYAQNDLLPIAERDGEVGILLFDEITSCTANVRTAAMQLMDASRKVGSYKLPDKWLVVCLGNGEEDGGNFQGMEFAFLNRCLCYRVNPVLYCTKPELGLGWVQWAFSKGVNSSVISFLMQNESYFHKFNVDDPAALFPSPRSWTALSRKLNLREAKIGGASLQEDTVLMYACGAVGLEAGRLFSIFYKLKSSIPSVEDVLNGKVNVRDRSFASSDGRRSRESLCLLCSNMIGYLVGEFTPEFDIYERDANGNKTNRIDISKIDTKTNQIRVSDKVMEHIDGFINFLISLPDREDILYLWHGVMTPFSGVLPGILSKSANYQEFKKLPIYAELAHISNLV